MDRSPLDPGPLDPLPAPGLEQVAQATPPMTGAATTRAVRALALRTTPEPADIPALIEELADLVPEGV